MSPHNVNAQIIMADSTVRNAHPKEAHVAMEEVILTCMHAHIALHSDLNSSTGVHFEGYSCNASDVIATAQSERESSRI